MTERIESLTLQFRSELTFYHSIGSRMSLRKENLILVLLTTIVFLVGASNSNAAQTVVGRIVDGESNQPIPQANVLLYLERAEDSPAIGAASEDDGRFSIPVANPGIYELKVQVIGYEDYIQSGIDVKAISKPLRIGRVTLHSTALDLPSVSYQAQRVRPIYRLTKRFTVSMKT